MIPTRGATKSLVPLWPFLVSIHGVVFTMTDGTIYFILNLVEVTIITLLHIIYLITEVLLLSLPPPYLSHGHV
jgi:hypothetical protein